MWTAVSPSVAFLFLSSAMIIAVPLILACLRECGLVTATAEGRRVRYELADQRLADGLRILAALDLPGTCP